MPPGPVPGGPWPPQPSQFGGPLFPPPPDSSSNERVTKGGGGRWWIALLAVVGVLLLIGIVALPGGDDPLAGPAREGDDADNGGGGSESESPREGRAEGRSEDPSADQGPGGGPGGGFDDLFRPDSLAVDDTSVWVSDFSCGVVVQIDRATEAVVGSVDIGGSASGVAIADGAVWVGNRQLSQVVRLDPASITVEGVVPVPGFALGLTTDPGSSTGGDDDEVWATDPISGSVHRIDATTGALIDTIGVGVEPHHVVIDGDTAWVTNSSDDTVSRIDIPRTGTGTSTGTGTEEQSPGAQASAPISVGARPLHVEIGDGSAWVTNSQDATVTRLDATTGETLAVIDVGPLPHALAFAAGSVWVGTELTELWRIDPATNEATLVAGANFDSIDMAVDGTDVWVADARAGHVVAFDAQLGQVAATIDLAEYGDCETFRQEAVVPPLSQAV